MTVLGMVLTGVVAVGLAVPSVVPGLNAGSAGDQSTNAVGSDAPTPNANFTPAVQTPQGGEHEHDEGAEYEEHDD